MRSSPGRSAILLCLLTIAIVVEAASTPGASTGNGINPLSPDPLSTTGLTATTRPDAATRTQGSGTFLGLPLGFESNCGKPTRKVKFLARGSRHTFFLTPTEAVLVLRTLQRRTATSAVADTPDRIGTGDAVVVHLQWIGAEPEPRIRGVERQPGKRHYLLGNDPANWCTNVAAYARVEYRDLYPGVDLVYSTNGENLRYDILVAPGTNPEAITLAFEGAERLEIDDKGGLLVHTTAGSIRQPRPGNLLQGLPHTSPSAAGPGRRSRGVRRVRS